MTRIVWLLGLVLGWCLPCTVRAQVQLGDQVQMLSISGQVSADQKAANQYGYAGVSIAFENQSPDKVVWVGVVKAETWNQDEFAGRQMIAEVQGYTPTMTAVGKQALVTKIREAPVGSRIVIEGIFDQGARNFQIGSVRVTPRTGS